MIPGLMDYRRGPREIECRSQSAPLSSAFLMNSAPKV